MHVGKKNLLYKNWLIYKDENSKQRYKIYRNKLTSIIRKAERSYYRCKLEQCKNDVKGTWTVINQVLKKDKTRRTECEFMYKGDKKVYDSLEIVNMFNDFYINVGPNLANTIDVSNKDIEYDTYLKDVNVSQSMFIKPTTENEILQIIDSFKNKSSEDIDGISMKLIKQVKTLCCCTVELHLQSFAKVRSFP